jgi:hypothetical protein
VQIAIRPGSAFEGGEIRFEGRDGELLGSARASGSIRETLPANGRVTLVATAGQRRTDYLINANAPLTDVQRYLYRGRFLLDFPTLTPGEVPVSAWRLDAFADALRQANLVY